MAGRQPLHPASHPASKPVSRRKLAILLVPRFLVSADGTVDGAAIGRTCLDMRVEGL